jgi:ABC-type glutathione transport system ATPase component
MPGLTLAPETIASIPHKNWGASQFNGNMHRHPALVCRLSRCLAGLQRELLAANHFAVEAIDLKVRQGEFIAIVGPSGCGKSTFMKLTTGLKMPSMGKILIDGSR